MAATAAQIQQMLEMGNLVELDQYIAIAGVRNA